MGMPSTEHGMPVVYEESWTMPNGKMGMIRVYQGKSGRYGAVLRAPGASHVLPISTDHHAQTALECAASARRFLGKAGFSRN